MLVALATGVAIGGVLRLAAWIVRERRIRRAADRAVQDRRFTGGGRAD